MNFVQKGTQARNQNNKNRENIARLQNEEPQMTISEITETQCMA